MTLIAWAPAPPVRGLVATLEDEARDLPGDRIAWSTYWKLCWEPYPGARGYELQALTGEGMSPRLERRGERCLRLEAAAGENEKGQGLANRDVLLALQSAQLAYRVRAVLDDDRTTDWSVPAEVGRPVPGTILAALDSPRRRDSSATPPASRANASPTEAEDDAIGPGPDHPAEDRRNTQQEASRAAP